MVKQKTKKQVIVQNPIEDALKQQLARTMADYDNLVKRTERERTELFKIVAAGMVSKFLPLLDNLESANNHLKDAGLAITIGEFKKLLSEEGFSEIKPEIGSQFDENTMEAIEIINGEDNNTVSEVVLVGWKYNDDSVIRHAKVKVVKVNN